MLFKRQVFSYALAAALFCSLATTGTLAVGQVATLRAFNADISQTSVSGLSSGAYMAVQFEVAHSSIVKGAGVIAGGPYFCAQGSVVTATAVCSCTLFQPLCHTSDGATDVPALVGATRHFAQSGAIDGTTHLANHRVYLFSGALDTKVPPSVVRDLAKFYKAFTNQTNIRLVANIRASHAMPTLSFGNPCDTSEAPYIDRCGYDAAGELLAWIYGSLHPARMGALGGAFVEFDQGEFLSNPTSHGMDTSGWIYVPANCSAGQRCRVHVALHGCRQGQSFSALSLPFAPIGAPFGRTFIDHAGYNRWADTNDIIVLYPQAVATLMNPQGCWDWWGYDGSNYAVKAGHQIAAIRAMVDRLTSARP
jgi:poly(3-hydroxybutyrate) depolymerase